MTLKWSCVKLTDVVRAGLSELADEADSKSVGGNIVRVQVPQPALNVEPETWRIRWFQVFYYLESRWLIMMNRKVKQQVNAAINELDMNLSNNYKDLAHKALRELDELVEKLHAEGNLKDKDYAKLADRVSDYKRRMSGYHH